MREIANPIFEFQQTTPDESWWNWIFSHEHKILELAVACGLPTPVQVLRRLKRGATTGKMWNFGVRNVRLVISRYHVTLTTCSLNSSSKSLSGVSWVLLSPRFILLPTQFCPIFTVFRCLIAHSSAFEEGDSPVGYLRHPLWGLARYGQGLTKLQGS